MRVVGWKEKKTAAILRITVFGASYGYLYFSLVEQFK